MERVGECEGLTLGCDKVGDSEGVDVVGDDVGFDMLGDVEGLKVNVGEVVGDTVGVVVGLAEVGETLGFLVGAEVMHALGIVNGVNLNPNLTQISVERFGSINPRLLLPDSTRRHGAKSQGTFSILLSTSSGSPTLRYPYNHPSGCLFTT